MGGAQGWYVGRIQVASVASAKAGGSTSVTDTVFQWTGSGRPTVAAAGITGLTAIVGGPYPTRAAAQAAAAGDKSTVAATAGSGAPPGVSTSTVGSSGGHLPNPLSGLAAIGDFFGRLTQSATWIRVAKVITGGLLLVVGLAHMTGASNAAAQAARRVPLPV